jgi:hypothetical protein
MDVTPELGFVTSEQAVLVPACYKFRPHALGIDDTY